MMRAEATGLIHENDVVVGVQAQTPDGPVEVRAELVIAADGRGSTLREVAGLKVEDKGAPMDVLWMRLSRHATDPGATLGRLDAGRLFITINRGDYWQCAFIIPKGGIAEVHAAGLDAFRAEIVRLAPHFVNRVEELATWNDVKLLTVAVNRLVRWDIPGMLCIGDAAHAMSPVGGVGVNLAIQDAVAAANVLVPRMRQGRATEADLRAIQKRRDFPTRATQRVQVLIQDRVITSVLRGKEAPKPPLPLRLLQRFPWLRRFPARAMGMGLRPEHIRH
jgi:2-polyprenyl-6-methoxyphenol hydroxylase-like FAD-dependent oxidoreductase